MTGARHPRAGGAAAARPHGRPARRRLAALAGAAAAPAAADAGVTLSNEVRLPRDLNFEGTLVGGLSSLDHDPSAGRYWAISDDRGDDREGSGPPRFYELDLAVDADGIRDVTVTDMVTIERPDGTPFPSGTVDPEGLRVAADGTLVWSSEGIRQPVDGVEVRRDPSLRRMTAAGAFLGEIDAPDHHSTATAEAGVRADFGYEALALDPDGTRAFAVNENALIQHGPPPTFGTPGVTRLGVCDLAMGAPTAEHVHLADAPREMPDPEDAPSSSGVAEMLALGDDRFLMLERQFTVGSPTARTGNHLMRICLAEVAPDTTDVLDTPALEGADHTPMRERLVVDLNDLLPLLHNVEGLVFAPGDDPDDGVRVLLLNADDNFGAETLQQFIALAVPDAALAPI